MIQQQEICTILASLNKFINHVKRTVSLNNIFVNLKCRLRLENATRWGSAFLVLETIRKAHEKNAFEASEQLPVPIKVIDVYLRILKPAYLVNVSLQSSNSNIGEVIPNIIRLINYWTSLKVTNAPKQLCDKLIDQFKQRFHDEIESKIYKVKIVPFVHLKAFVLK